MTTLPHWPEVLAAACLGAAFWTLVGWPVARRVMPGSAGLAPVIGWSLHAAMSATLLAGVGTGWPLLLLGVWLLSLVWTWHVAVPPQRAAVWLPWYVPVLAAFLAVPPAAAVMPHLGPAGMALAAPIFDHSKIALVDGLLRSGVPPVNPFYGGAAGHGLAYYYWWHLTAAELARGAGLGGWAGDAAMTLVTAWISLMLMAGLGFAFQGRAGAVLALALAQVGGLRPWLAPLERHGILRAQTGLDAWLNQASWAPQHLQSACCLVLAVLVTIRLAARPTMGSAALLGCVVAAGFGCSTWVGGVTAVAVLAAALLVLGVRVPATARAGFFVRLSLAAGVALLLVAPLLRDELASAALRGGSAPVALSIFPLFAVAVPRLLNVPGFPILMLVEFPVLAVLGVLGLARIDRALAAAAAASVAVCCLLASTIDNNDLGWRAILPALLILTPAAAAGLAASWQRSRWRTLPLLVPALLGLAGTAVQLREDFTPIGRLSAPVLQERLAGWAAMRRVSGPTDRVLDNPALDAGLSRWPANLSWALLADRPSCYSGWATAHPFAPLPVMALYATDREVARIYAGAPAPADLGDIAARLQCRFALLTRDDAAWLRDPFGASPLYRLSAFGDGWRLYQAVTGAAAAPPPAAALR